MRTRIGLDLASAMVLACTVALAAPAAGASATVAPRDSRAIAGAAATSENVPAFGHVFLIIGENTTYSHLTAVNAP